MINAPAFPGESLAHDDNVSEQDRYARIIALTPESPDVLRSLIEALGDKSWRVRKGSLQAIDRLRGVPKLITALIDGLGSQDNAGLRNACAEALVSIGEDAVPELSEALGTSDLDQRKFVVEVLGHIGTRGALRSLLGALEQSDSNVRAAVVDSLGQIGGLEVVQELTARLAAHPEDLQLAVYVLDALARVHARIPCPQLVGYLKQPQLKRFVYPLLGLTQDKAAVAPLLEGIIGSSRGARRMALPALARVVRDLGSVYETELAATLRQSPGIRDALLEGLQEEDERVVDAAVLTLGLYGDVRDAAPVLITCAARNLIQSGLQAVGRMGPAAVKPLLSALEAVDMQTQLLFLDVIETIGDARAVPELLHLARGANTYTAGAALRALGRIAGVEAIDPLMDVVREGESELVRQAAFALANIGARHANAVAGAVRRVIESGDVEAAWFAVLGSVGRPDDVEVIMAACRHGDADVRLAAVEALQAFGSRIPEGKVLACLDDEEPRVRTAAARILALYRSDKVVASLLAAMSDIDPWVVAEAARSLGAIGGRLATQSLELAASSPTAPIAIAALQSLSRLEAQGLESTVRKALRHADPEVTREALGVASRLDVVFATKALGDCLQHRAWDVRLRAAELLLNNHLRVAAPLIEDCLHKETEPLVRDKLERLRDALA